MHMKMQIDHPIGRLAYAGAYLPSELTLVLIGALVLFFALAVIFFVVLGQRIQRVAADVRNREKATQNLASELEAQALLARQMSIDLEELRKRVGDQNEVIPAAPPFWGNAEIPVNLNRRGQIIRLARKGKSVAEIAQDLNVAQGEVELLLKVHDLSHQKAEL
jgi:hypothetical protein